jgi:hypothetical protein
MSRMPAWSPLSLTALLGWWKSDVGTTVVTGVSQWNDQSGNGNHMLQATGIRQPALVPGVLNGLPAIVFDGVDDYLRAAFALIQPCTIFIVLSQITWTANDSIHDGAAVANTMRLHQTPAGVSPQLTMRAASALAANSDLPLNTYGLVTEIFNGASSVMQVNNAAALAGNVGAGDGAGITLGSAANLTGHSNVGVVEAMIMGAPATAAERANVRAYVTGRTSIVM